MEFGVLKVQVHGYEVPRFWVFEDQGFGYEVSDCALWVSC